MTTLQERIDLEFEAYGIRQTTPNPNDDQDSIKDAYAGVAGVRGVLRNFTWTGSDVGDVERLVEALAAARIEFLTMWDDESGVGGAAFNWLRMRATTLVGLPPPRSNGAD